MLKNYIHKIIITYVNICKNRGLIAKLFVREVSSKYKGSILGILWTIVNPLFMLSIYTFVFSFVFQAKWGNDIGQTRYEFALILFSGLAVFNFFSEVVVNSPNIIISNTSFVKKVIFPLEVLFYAMVSSALFTMLINIILILFVNAAFRGFPEMDILMIPLAIVPLAVLTLGVSLIIGSLGVYLRDIKHILGPIVTGLLFLSPIFYPKNALPPAMQMLMGINPLTYPIEFLRAVMFNTAYPSAYEFFIYLLLSILICSIGFYWFEKSRRGFADVL